MTPHIEDADVWLFRELYFVLAAFADDPANTISRIGGGRISIPNDQAEDLGHFLRVILEKYPEATNLQVIQAAKEIDAIFTRKSLGGDAFEKEFWTNAGFMRHWEWHQIRELARGFLLR